MTEVWITIAGLAVATIAIKALPPILLGGRPLPATVTSIISLLAPALLAAFVVVQTFSERGELTLDERALGVGAAGATLVWRRSLMLAVVVAATVTAAARALG
jgi:branched-subunit amino acid transport protein